MIEKKEPSFFKYFDYNTGKMKKDAPDSAKKAYKQWQNGNDMAVKKPTRKVRKTTKK